MEQLKRYSSSIIKKKPSKVIRRALEKEVEEKMNELLCKKAEETSKIASKVGKNEWIKAIRESREER